MQEARFKEADRVISDLKRKNWHDYKIRVENGSSVQELSTNEIYQNGKLYGIMKSMQGSSPVAVTVFDNDENEVFSRILHSNQVPMEQDENGTFTALTGVRLKEENRHLKQQHDLEIAHRSALSKIEKEKDDAVLKYNNAIEKHEDFKQRLAEKHEREIKDLERDHRLKVEKLDETIAKQRKVIAKYKPLKAELDALQKRYDKIEPISKLANYGMGLLDEFTPAITVGIGRKVGGDFGAVLEEVGMAGLQAKYLPQNMGNVQQPQKEEPKLPADIQKLVDFMLLIRRDYPQYSMDMMAVIGDVTVNSKFAYFQKIAQILAQPNGAESLNFLFVEQQTQPLNPESNGNTTD